MELKIDSSGNHYIEVGTGRATYVKGDTRAESKNWAGEDVIRLQAYRGPDTKLLHQGEELPVGKGNLGVFRMLQAISALVLDNGDPQ